MSITSEPDKYPVKLTSNNDKKQTLNDCNLNNTKLNIKDNQNKAKLYLEIKKFTDIHENQLKVNTKCKNNAQISSA